MSKKLLSFTKVACVTLPFTCLCQKIFGLILNQLHSAGYYFPSGLISGWKEFHFGADLILFPIFALAMIVGLHFLMQILWKKKIYLVEVCLASAFLLILWWTLVQPGMVRYFGRSLNSNALIMWSGLQLSEFWLSMIVGLVLAIFIYVIDYLKQTLYRPLSDFPKRKLSLLAAAVVLLWVIYGIASSRYSSAGDIFLSTISTALIVSIAFISLLLIRSLLRLGHSSL